MTDAINSWDKNRPAGTDYIDASDELIRANQAAVEEMTGGWMQDLIVTNGGSAGQIDIDATRLGLIKSSGTPPLIFVDRSTNLTCDWGNGEAINGREAGLATTAGWKYVWVLRDPVAGNTGSLFSAATAVGGVTMPGDYAFGRLVGTVYWDGASDFTAFIQRGNRVAIKSPPQVLNNGRSDLAWTQLDLSAYIPTITREIFGYSEFAYPGNLTYENALVKLSADSSGNYQGFYGKWQLGISQTAYTIMSFSFQQAIDESSQSIYYWTQESYGSCLLDLYLGGYTVKI